MNPWEPVASSYEPTMTPCELMSVARVVVLPAMLTAMYSARSRRNPLVTPPAVYIPHDLPPTIYAIDVGDVGTGHGDFCEGPRGDYPLARIDRGGVGCRRRHGEYGDDRKGATHVPSSRWQAFVTRPDLRGGCRAVQQGVDNTPIRGQRRAERDATPGRGGITTGQNYAWWASEDELLSTWVPRA